MNLELDGKTALVTGGGRGIGRAVALMLAEAWGGPGGLRTAAGVQIGPAPRSINFAIWWDGDLLRELLAGPRITKWDWQQAREELVFETSNPRRRSRHSRPTLSADLIGDWREESASVDFGNVRVRDREIGEAG